MKKFMALILTLALIMSMSIVAFAEDFDGNGTWGEGQNKHPLVDDSYSNVTVTVTPATDTYHVVIAWESLTFTYSFGAWNPETHEYLGGWQGATTANVTVENHSNAQVWGTVEINDVDDGVTLSVNKSEFELDSADSDTYRQDAGTNGYTYKGDIETIQVTVSGQPADRTATSIDAGTVTVSISSTAPATPNGGEG